MYILWKKVSRHLILFGLFFLAAERKRALERWLRGREEFRRLQLADCVLVSFGKSGRTWLRVMLSRFYQVKHGLSRRSMLGFDNLHRKNREIPRIFFTHDNYLKDYTKNGDSKADYADKKVVLLVRDPRDVAVSQFFQWKFRMRQAKKTLNQYPVQAEELAVFDFVLKQEAGLPRVVDFLNGWAEEMPRLGNIQIIRYEDMRSDPAATLRKILDFIGTPGSDEQIKEAVAFASYENMKKLEEKKVFWLSGSRLMPRDRKNPNSYKVRRAKVGGYRDYFNDQELAEVDRFVDTKLSPIFGYTTGSSDSEAVNA